MLPKSRVALACGLLLLAVTVQLHGGKETVASVRIGLLAPSDEPEATCLQQGATLGVELANSTSGRRVELVIRGRPGQWGTEGDEASALALDDEVDVIIAPPGGAASHQVLQVAGRTRVPVISLCPDSSITRTGIPWTIRIVPRAEEEARAIFLGSRRTDQPQCSVSQGGASVLASQGPSTNGSAGASPHRRLLRGYTPRRWAALVPEGRSGRETANDLLAAARAAGSMLFEPIKLARNPADWTQQLETLLADRPDAVLLWIDPSTAGQLACALRQARFSGLLAGPARLQSGEFLCAAGKGSAGFLVPGTVGDEESEKSRARFVESYRRCFSSDPDVTATMACDAALLIAELARKSAGQPFSKSFPVQTEFHGASGSLRFDAEGNRVMALRLLVVRDGQFQPLETKSHPN